MKEHNELVRVADRRDLSLASPATPPPIDYEVDSEDSEIHLRNYWNTVRKHLFLIISITVLSTIMMAIYVSRQTDIYEAKTRIQVGAETNPAYGTASSKSGSIILNGGSNDPTYFSSQLQILSGAGLMRRVVKTLDLEHNQAFFSPGGGKNRSMWQNLLLMVGKKSKDDGEKPQSKDLPLTTSVAPATAREDLAEAERLEPYVSSLQASVYVEPVKEARLTTKETRLIDISFRHADPQISAKVVNAIADTFVLSNLEKKTETNASAGEFLQKRIAELQNDIRAGEERLINYAKSNQIISLTPGQNTVVERLATLNSQLLEAENQRKTAQAVYNAAQAPGAAAASTADSTKGNEAQIVTLKQKRAELLVENTEEWPEVKAIDQQIAVLEKSIQETRKQAVNNQLTNLETKYREALAREQSLRQAFEQQRAETLTQNEAAINYRIIEQEIATNKGLLDGLLQRAKENDLVIAGMAGASNNIDVVDYAIAPKSPIGPKRMQLVGLAFTASLLLSICLAFVLEYMDDSIRTSDDLQRFTQLPTLAAIPKVKGPAQRQLFSFLPSLVKSNGSKNNHPLIIHEENLSSLREAYRQLRTSVLLSAAGRSMKIFMIASSQPNEGKTTTAINLALTLEQTQSKVVIIDADMRHPSLHAIFGLEGGKGLSDILAKEPKESEVLSVVQQDKESGLHVLAAGPMVYNPAELLISDRLRQLIAILKNNFDYVILDSPPLAFFTDGVLVSTVADGVILVAESGKSSRELLRQSRRVLQDAGSTILGIVLNNTLQDSRGSYYYYYHQQR